MRRALPRGQDGHFKTGQKMYQKAEVLDYSDYQIAPGLVDTHIHGFAGYDVMDNSEESLLGMSQACFQQV